MKIKKKHKEKAKEVGMSILEKVLRWALKKMEEKKEK